MDRTGGIAGELSSITDSYGRPQFFRHFRSIFLFSAFLSQFSYIKLRLTPQVEGVQGFTGKLGSAIGFCVGSFFPCNFINFKHISFLDYISH